MRGRSRSRSQSRNRVQQVGSIIDRLGIRQPRKRMRQGQNVAQQQQQQQRGRSRSRGRVRLNRNNFNNRAPSTQAQQFKRSNSVNGRLGNNGPAQIRRRRRFASNTRNPNTQINKPIGGRIIKRNPRNQVGARIQRNVRKNGNALGINGRGGGQGRGRGGGRVVKRWIQIT